MNDRFDLEKSLAAWRRSLEHNDAFLPDDRDELEQHVRDQVAALLRRGLTEEAAFDRAMAEMGGYGAVEDEYRKVYWGKRRRRRELTDELRERSAMLKNYLKVAGRNLRREKAYAAINVAGLAVGIACCLLMLLYVRDELRYDAYHEQADRIYRISTRDWATTPPALAPALREAYPHLAEHAVRLWPLFSPAKVRRGDVVFVESGGVFADPAVFSVFSWPLVAGTADGALAAPNTMVLTRSMAHKYFGSEDPVGSTLRFWGNDVTVTGVVEDVPPGSHLRFDFLVSASTLYDVMGSGLDEDWGMPAFYTYVLAKEGVAPAALEAAVWQLFDAHQVAADSPPVLQPIRQIYLHSHRQGEAGPRGNVAYLYVLATAAALVLLLACVNFTNLTTARAATRAKEVGLRKVMGAHRSQLVGQFFGETILMSLAALAVALGLVALALPAFNQMAGKAIQLRLAADPALVAGLAGIVVVIGLVAGSYPALFVSRFQPARVLKGTGGLPASNLFLRKGLVVFQFTVSIALSIGVAVVVRQLGYLQGKDLGFDRAHVLVLDGDRFPLVREALRDVPGVIGVAGAPRVVGEPLPSSPYVAEGSTADSTRRMLYAGATPGFIETMGMRLVAGRSFVDGSAPDEREAFILNETAVRALGWDPAGAVGKSFGMSVPPYEGGGEVWREGRIVGVVQDYHHDALYRPIEPVALYPSGDLNLTFVRLRPAGAAVLAAVEAVWKRVNPDAPFNHYFLDAHLRQQYAAEQRLGSIMGAATGLALLIACLGLFGLAAFTAGQRTKEIGVRKVLGASAGQVVLLLSTDFLKLVGLAALLGAPLAYVAMARWLEHFAYRIEIGPGLLLLVSLLAFAVALLTVGYQAVRAALADPVKSLRYE